MLKAIIFDVDGTLAETEEAHRAAFNRAFAEAGLGWHWSETLYGELLKVTGGKERLAFFIDSAGGLGMSPTGVSRLIAELHWRKTAIYSEIVASGGIELRPGIAELIETALLDGVRLAIATTTSRPNVDALIESTLGADGIAAFETIAAGDSVPRKKPAPDVFIAALDSLALPPCDCIAVEDSENGLRAALGAGLATLITPSRYSRGEDFTGAAAIVGTLPALVQERKGGPAASAPADILEAVRDLHRASARPNDAVRGMAAAE
ncbi:MAG: HAD-IA family hydrolase [Rhodomicrobium sp.]|nr:HAD-IA family hydrolase [Rhodomicrobium sp.]